MRFCGRWLIVGCLLTCGLAQADPRCYTFYLNEPVNTVGSTHDYTPASTWIPLLERVKVTVLITGDQITSYHQIELENYTSEPPIQLETEVYVNGQDTQEIQGSSPTCTELLGGALFQRVQGRRNRGPLRRRKTFRQVRSTAA